MNASTPLHTSFSAVLLSAMLVATLLLPGCVPKQVEGIVLEQQWTDDECSAAMRIRSGDVVVVRFLLAIDGRSGFDPILLKKDSLRGKTIRCDISSGYVVERCTVLLPQGNRILHRIGDRDTP